MYNNIITLSDDEDGGDMSIAGYINSASDLFDEHFPGLPVLPGAFSLVLCINFALKYIKTKYKTKYVLYLVEKISFLRFIDPSTTIHINLIGVEHFTEKIRVIFSVRDNVNNQYVKGVLFFKEKI